MTVDLTRYSLLLPQLAQHLKNTAPKHLEEDAVAFAVAYHCPLIVAYTFAQGLRPDHDWSVAITRIADFYRCDSIEGKEWLEKALNDLSKTPG